MYVDINHCVHTRICPSCNGAGGQMRNVHRCQAGYGACCCTGCWNWEWVSCHRCCGTGVITVRRPAPYIQPWPAPWRPPPRLRSSPEYRDGAEDARRARA